MSTAITQQSSSSGEMPLGHPISITQVWWAPTADNSDELPLTNSLIYFLVYHNRFIGDQVSFCLCNVDTTASPGSLITVVDDTRSLALAHIHRRVATFNKNCVNQGTGAVFHFALAPPPQRLRVTPTFALYVIAQQFRSSLIDINKKARWVQFIIISAVTLCNDVKFLCLL